EALLDADFQEGGGVPVTAVQEIEHRIAARAARVAGREVDEKRPFAGERRGGEARAIDRAAGAVMADGDERGQRGQRRRRGAASGELGGGRAARRAGAENPVWRQGSFQRKRAADGRERA